jgi:crotonobetainyl-CoA:carnitine CoA-transferase CaiB-like acyl-CoA transferase
VDDSYPDPVSGLAVGTALALGLISRASTGRGCYVESSMLVSTGYALSNDLAGGGDRSSPMVDSGQHGVGPLYRLYECAEGWLFLGICQEREWDGLTSALGREELLDARFAWPAGATAGDLAASLSRVFAREPAAAWVELLTAAGVPAVVADGDGFETMLQRIGFLSPANHATVGPYWRLAPRVDIDGVAPDRRPATGPGECTAPLLAELGYAAVEIDDLVRRGVALRTTSSPNGNH